MSKAILYDATTCTDCKMCEKACADQNHLPYDDKIAAEETMSTYKLTYVKAWGDKFMRRLCMNCEDSTCVSVCPVAALRKTPEGPVTCEAERCIGCRYCTRACPFEVPKSKWSSLLPQASRSLLWPSSICRFSLRQPANMHPFRRPGQWMKKV